MGNILQDLFSPEELEEEGRIALGEERMAKEIKITKLENSKEEKWDMNIESEDSSGPPSQLEGSGLVMYNKLHDLRSKIYNFRHHDPEEGTMKMGLDEAFIESLPISMKSLSNCESLKLTNLLKGLKSRDSSLFLEQKYGKTCGDTKPAYENTSEVTPQAGLVFGGKGIMSYETLLSENKLSLDEQERLVLTLIENEVSEGRDVCLDDLLDISRSDQGFSEKPSPIGPTDQSRSETSLGSFLQSSYLKPNENESLNLSGTLTFKGSPGKQQQQEKDSILVFSEFLQDQSSFSSHTGQNISQDIALSSIQSDLSSNPVQQILPKNLDLSNESSIAFIQDTSMSFISETSQDDINRKQKVKNKQANLVRRPKLSDKEDPMSFIFPPLNISSDSKQQESKIFPKLPIIPNKPPTEPPKYRYLNLRGRSLQPIASPKSVLPPCFEESKVFSPSPVNKFRMQRYKELTRPYLKIGFPQGVVPQEPK